MTDDLEEKKMLKINSAPVMRIFQALWIVFQVLVFKKYLSLNPTYFLNDFLEEITESEYNNSNCDRNHPCCNSLSCISRVVKHVWNIWSVICPEP